MNQIEQYEEKYTSVYCRLSYEVWYQGCKDDISKYLKQNNSLDKALRQFVTDKKELKVIKIDGVACKNKYDLKECMEAMIHFLYMNEEYSIICAFPYEQQKNADRCAYDYISNTIDVLRFIEEMHEQNYMLMIRSISPKSERYLKILPGGEGAYAIHYRNKEVETGKIQLNTELNRELIDWAKKYVSDNKFKEFFEGLSYAGRERFSVSFGMDKLGYEKNEWNISDFGFEKIDGNGAITKLLQMPELSRFIKEEVE